MKLSVIYLHHQKPSRYSASISLEANAPHDPPARILVYLPGPDMDSLAVMLPSQIAESTNYATISRNDLNDLTAAVTLIVDRITAFVENYRATSGDAVPALPLNRLWFI